MLLSALVFEPDAFLTGSHFANLHPVKEGQDDEDQQCHRLAPKSSDTLRLTFLWRRYDHCRAQELGTFNGKGSRLHLT
eukprot:CAMPEP_0172824428 /NCGR_PEP_ID=MMETSP1075-20121228/18005_1 /TAXON_ID=2916 /ORGANISM="Ceratium fusus, Strain PA161109" /LENGTH=77 /DNA_ID=CAMNT_0013665709 /DNA_START=148 /DNA_END=377 /DNA_ORIENTATION=+